MFSNIISEESAIFFVYVTFPNPDEAKTVCTKMLQQKLAVCANISNPRTSIYTWKGKIEEASEVCALIKTTIEKLEDLQQELTKLHSYEVPLIASWPADCANSEYPAWARLELGLN